VLYISTTINIVVIVPNIKAQQLLKERTT